MAHRSYVATVQKVFPRGRHGPYAKARSETLGNVTFSLEPQVWCEAKWPEEGMLVVMTDLLKKTAGWRADKCRLLRPEDAEATETPSSTATSDERKEATNA